MMRSQWSEGQVWVSPERHGAVSGIMKLQIDWIAFAIGSIRPTQDPHACRHASLGRLAAVNQMRI